MSTLQWFEIFVSIKINMETDVEYFVYESIQIDFINDSKNVLTFVNITSHHNVTYFTFQQAHIIIDVTVTFTHKSISRSKCKDVFVAFL